MIIRGILLFAVGYLVALWSGGWLYITTIPMWIVGLSLLILGLVRFIQQLK